MKKSFALVSGLLLTVASVTGCGSSKKTIRLQLTPSRPSDKCRVPNYFIKVFANCFMKKSADCTTYMQKVPRKRNFFD